MQEKPWIVELLLKGEDKNLCLGTLVAKNYVITDGNCMKHGYKHFPYEAKELEVCY